MKEKANSLEEDQQEFRRYRHHHGFHPAAGLLIIVIGILFLLNSTGIVSSRIWSIVWRFWPLVLILIGVRFILGRTKPARVIMIIITCLVILYILLTAIALTTPAFYFWIARYFPWLGASMLPFRQTMTLPIQY